MPQRPSQNFLIPVKGLDLAGDIRKAWKEKKFRPTITWIGVGFVSHGVYAVPFVHYENGPGGQLILPQSIIQANTSLEAAAWAMISDAFKFTLPPKAKKPTVACVGYYDHRMPAGRRPEGFSQGKRYYFGIMDIDTLSIAEKDVALQKDSNPIQSLAPLVGLHQIRRALSHIPDEGKRWACSDAVDIALQERFDRDHDPKRKVA
jgi:hypothetical protein